MPKSTSVESIDNVEHGLHLPGFSAMVPLYDTSFPLLVERVHAHNFVDLLCSSSEFLVTVIGSGVHHASYSSRHLFRFRYTICFFWHACSSKGVAAVLGNWIDNRLQHSHATSCAISTAR
jgi:hypothetical protein